MGCRSDFWRTCGQPAAALRVAVTIYPRCYAAAKGNPSALRMVLNAIQDLDLAELEANPLSITSSFVEPASETARHLGGAGPDTS
jgi:hypothetical protein